MQFSNFLQEACFVCAAGRRFLPSPLDVVDGVFFSSSILCPFSLVAAQKQAAPPVAAEGNAVADVFLQIPPGNTPHRQTALNAGAHTQVQRTGSFDWSVKEQLAGFRSHARPHLKDSNL